MLALMTTMICSFKHEPFGGGRGLVHILYGINFNTLMFLWPHPSGNDKTGAIEKVIPGAQMKMGSSLVPMEMERYACVGGHLVFMDYLHGDRKPWIPIDENGWLHSGDIGRMDSDGIRWHVGVMCTSLGKCI